MVIAAGGEQTSEQFGNNSVGSFTRSLRFLRLCSPCSTLFLRRHRHFDRRLEIIAMMKRAIVVSAIVANGLFAAWMLSPARPRTMVRASIRFPP
jgi:hypothetical protein